MKISTEAWKKILCAVFWLIIMIIKNGLHFQGHSKILFQTVQDFPTPVSFASSNLLPISILQLFKINNEYRWNIFFGVLSLIAILVLLLSIQFRSGQLKDLFSAFVISSPVLTLLSGNVGLLDIFPFAFWLLYFYGPLRFRNLSILLLLLSTPEQGLVSLIAIWFLEKSTGKSFTNNQIRRLILLSATILVITNVWLLLNNVPARSWLLLKNFLGSAEVFLVNFPNLFLSGYGPIWLLIIYFVIRVQAKFSFSSVVALIVIPTLFTILTLDGSRVFIMISTPLVIIILREVFSDEKSARMIRQNTLLITFFLISYPTLIFYNGAVYQPLNYTFLSDLLNQVSENWTIFVENIQSAFGQIKK
jgi:hypothetical protein